MRPLNNRRECRSADESRARQDVWDEEIEIIPGYTTWNEDEKHESELFSVVP